MTPTTAALHRSRIRWCSRLWIDGVHRDGGPLMVPTTGGDHVAGADGGAGRGACCTAARARRSMARTLPRLASKMLWWASSSNGSSPRHLNSS